MMNIRSLLIIYLVHLSTFVYGRSTVSVDTNSATYIGKSISNGKGVAFYGVRYAKPPLGDLRFRAPVPYEPTVSANGVKQVINATVEPDFCIQAAFQPALGQRGGAGSEDCLHVNVYVPNKVLQSNSASKLPVLVYIHGGGFIYGNPLNWSFDNWIAQSSDIIIVSVYYRLSIFGFLTPPPGNGAADYNAGYLDQVEALKWVKKHISYFGGDPNHITIDGQSAGGASILYHLVDSSGNQGLFQQAIAQSVYRPTLGYPSQLSDCFNWIAAQAGCISSNSSDAAKVDCLRQADVSTLIGIVDTAQLSLRQCVSLPVIDGVVFKDTPTELVMQRKLSTVTLLAGSTTDESFAGSGNLTTELRDWWPFLTDADIGRFNQIYTSADFGGDESERVFTASGETLLRCGRETLVTAMTNASKIAYAYRWNEPNPTQGSPLVQHSAENWWMFQGCNTGNNGTYELTPFTNSSQSSFAAEAIAYWVSFVRSGNPNTYALPGSPQWPKWEGKGKRMVFTQGTTNNRGAYVSGSKAEAEPPKELQRCLTVDLMAPDLQF